jgi:hypothetical protein
MPFEVSSVVPQGSVLEPLLINVFTNDLRDAIKYSECLHFADDIKCILPIILQNIVNYYSMMTASVV